jgi:uncharacterized protein
MPHVDKHPPGDFCWLELATTDQNAAKNFYGALFGWDANDTPTGPNDFYTIFRIDGRNVAAAFTLRAEERERGIPTHWQPYIAVDSADAAAAKAADLGGTVVESPFDVFDAGRAAVIRDPTGAFFSIFQAKRQKGLGITGEPGAFCWADLNMPDAERAKQFYSGLFGWQLATGEKDSSGYLHIKNGDHFIGGVPPAQHRDPKTPPHWLIYIQVSDVDASAKKAQELGARIYAPPMTIEGAGRMAVLADPQGAVFAIFKSARRE